MFEATDGRPKQTLTVILIALCFSVFLRCLHIKSWNQTADLYRYNGGKPLLTTLDGYYYLRLAREYTEGNFEDRDRLSPIGKKPKPFSLLPLLTACFHRLLNVPLENIAFFLPVFLSSLMVLVYVAWGTVLAGPFLALSASIIGGSVYYWYMRTCPGRFDTDALIPFFVYGIPYLVYRHTVANKVKTAILWAVMAVVAGIAFCLWWLPALYAAPILILGTYAASILAYNRSKSEKMVKLLLCAAGVVIALLVLLAYLRILPDLRVFRLLMGFISLITHSKDSPEPSVSSSISELVPLTLSYFNAYVAGSWTILLLSCFGFLILLKSRKRELIFLIVPGAAGFMSLFSKRFLIFLIPLFAISTGYALHTVAKYIRQKLGVTYASISAVLILAVTVYLTGKRALNTFIPPNLLAPHVAIASSINNGYNPRELVWSWWDYGYFLEYFSEKSAFIDGGSQGGIRLFIAAYPFAQENPAVAARWIRFFAKHGPGAIYRLGKHTGSIEKAIEFLEKIFTEPWSLRNLATLYKLPSELNEKKFFFPESVKAYIFIPFEMIPASNWWYYYGTWDFRLRRGIHAQATATSRMAVDRNTGILVLKGSQLPVASLFIFKDSPEPALYLDRYYRNSGLYVIIGNRRAYIVTPQVKNSTFFKLLFTPYSVPHFRPIKYIPEYGGVWEVMDDFTG